MLPLLTKDIRVFVSPREVAMALVTGGKVLDARYQAFSDEVKVPCEEAIKIANEWVSLLGLVRVRATLLLSSELAPLTLIPWDHTGNFDNRKREALECFNRAGVDQRSEDDIFIATTGFGKPALVSSVHPSVLEYAKSFLDAINLISVKPLSVSLLNAALRKNRTPIYWFVVAENKNLIIFYIENSITTIIRTLPLRILDDFDLKDLLNREILMLGKTITNAPIFSASNLNGAHSLVDTGWSSGYELNAFPLHLIGSKE